MTHANDIVIEKNGQRAFVLTKKNATAKIELPSSPNIEVIAQDGSEVEIVDRLGKQRNSIRVFAGKGSRIKISSAGSGTSIRNAEIERNASVDWIDAITGDAKIRTTSLLNGKGSRTSITTAFFGSSNRLEIDAEAIHNSQDTTSSITIRGALAKNSKAIIKPSTKISGNAANSDGQQKVNVLLLNEDATTSATPKLEMGNSDIKASHSVSIGQLDREKLFYLMSRGLSEKEATNAIVKGFFEPLLNGMSLPGKEARQPFWEGLAKC